MSMYQILWYFLIYSFIGWVVEVIFHAIALGKIVNRGFLNGPVCPIYGFGVVSVFILVYYLGNHGENLVEDIPLWQLFLGGMVLASAIELLGGFLLDVLFHARWWDYSDKPFNLHGYICLEFSIIWGLAITFVIRGIQPYIRTGQVMMIPRQYGIPILVVLYAVLLADVIVTVLAVNRLNRKLAEIDKVQKSLRRVSDGLTDVIGGGAYKTAEKLEKGKEKAEEAAKQLGERAELAGQQMRENMSSASQQLGAGVREIRESISSSIGETRERMEQSIQEQKSQFKKKQTLYASILKERYFGMGRLLRAHPGMKHQQYPAIVEELQKELDKDETETQKNDSNS